MIVPICGGSERKTVKRAELITARLVQDERGWAPAGELIQEAVRYGQHPASAVTTAAHPSQTQQQSE